MLLRSDNCAAWKLNTACVQGGDLPKPLSASCITGKCQTIAVATLALLVLFSHAAVADSSIFRLTTGAEYTTGDFGGTESIDEWYVPVTGKYIADKYVLRVTVPYIRVTSPAGTIVSGGANGHVVVPGRGARTTQDGLGDVIAGVTYRDAFNTEASSDMALDLTAKIKFGTADKNKGLGTGENDSTIQAELFKFYDRFTPFGVVGYTFRGEPSGVKLSNSWLAVVGGDYRFSPALSGGLDLYFQEASSSLADDQTELTASLAYKLSNTQKLRGYLIQGLSDGSPDWGAGVMIKFTR